MAIQNIIVTIDVKDIRESHPDVSMLAANMPITLTFSKTYKKQVSIESIIIQSMPATDSYYYRILNKSLTSMDIEIRKNSDKALVDSTVDWSLAGY